MKGIKLCIPVILISIISGCAVLPRKTTSVTSYSLEPQAISKFADIPVPVGVKLVPMDSYAFESAGLRVGVLKYRGRVDADRVTSFYREQMPMYNWEVLNIVEYGQRLMNFDRETETCIITMDQKGKLLDITVTLGPKSQFSKKSIKPVK